MSTPEEISKHPNLLQANIMRVLERVLGDADKK